MTARLKLIALLFASLLFAIVLPGCSGGADVAGTYELDKQAVKDALQAKIDSEADAEDPMAAMGAGMMMGMIDMMSMTMTLNADGTASMAMSAMGDTNNATGTWTLDGDKITITAAAEGEEPEPASGTFKDGVITLNMDEDEDMPVNLVFRKKES